MYIAEEVIHNIHFSNILGYLGNTLPRLDAEVGCASSVDNFDDLPSVLLVNGECRATLRISFCD